MGFKLGESYIDRVFREIKEEFNSLDEVTKLMYINMCISNSFYAIRFLKECNINILTKNQFQKLKKTIISNPKYISSFIEAGFLDILNKKEKDILINTTITNNKDTWLRETWINEISLLRSKKLTEKEQYKVFKSFVNKTLPSRIEHYLISNNGKIKIYPKEIRFLIDYIFKKKKSSNEHIFHIGLHLYHNYKNVIETFPKDLIQQLENFLIIYKMTLESS